MNRLGYIPIPSFVLPLMLFLSACGNGHTDTRSQREWKVMEVSLSDISFDMRYPATIRGKQDVEIRPQVSGTITRLAVSEGELVKKGQVLFVIDQIPYRAAWQNAVAALKSAQAALATARLDYEGNRTLFESNVVSAHTLQRSHNELLAAEAAVAQAEASETEARNNLSYTEVRSPVDGVVGILPYRQGALVGPDIQEPLTTVSDNSEMDCYFSIDENSLLAFMRRFGSSDSAVVSIRDVSLVLSDGSVYDETGRVESISGVVDLNTGSAALRARFPNPQRLLHSGTTGNILLKSVYRNAVVIPVAATVKIQDRMIVYKVEEGKARQTFITVAPQNDGTSYIVLEGLENGDIIIADGVGLVREGQEIKAEE